MRLLTVSILAAMSAAFAGVASAQGYDSAQIQSVETSAPAVSTPASIGDAVSMPRGPLANGIAALNAQNFVRAEEMFSSAVRRNPRDAEANFYLGATRMDLGKWKDAQPHLELAARRLPSHPDPKGRLGVTYAKLGDTTGALEQRAALVRMASDCEQTCRLSPYIDAGISMIDEALAK